MKSREKKENPNGPPSSVPDAGTQKCIREHMEHENDTKMPDNDIEFEYNVTIVDGEYGHRLAAIQVESILEVVEWFSRHPSRPTTMT